MWMATADTGLAVAAYGPNTVTAKVGKEGRPVTIDQETDYPFTSTSTLTIHTERTVSFPLELRIPSWCEEPTVLVNKEPVTNVTAGTYHRIERAWSGGDVVQISFPMPVKISHWINDSVAVTRGPLVFSLLIEEEKTSTQSFLDDQFHTHEIRPASAWSYAILLAGSPTPSIETTVAKTMPAQPFKAADAPVRLQLKAAKTDLGGKFREDFPARAVEPPQSPVEVTGDIETITLVPYGSTEIRITQFPWVKK
jgi:DUF1680 family protein